MYVYVCVDVAAVAISKGIIAIKCMLLLLAANILECFGGTLSTKNDNLIGMCDNYIYGHMVHIAINPLCISKYFGMEHYLRLEMFGAVAVACSCCFLFQTLWLILLYRHTW